MISRRASSPAPSELERPVRAVDMAGGVTQYRDRTLDIVSDLLRECGPVPRAIDVGAGDGWIAKRLMEQGRIRHCTPVDVVRRERIVLEPTLYDGDSLPYDDSSVDLAYAVDAAHHAREPLRFLRELSRVSRRWVLLKDHTYRTVLGRVTLRLLDEVGNRRFSIGSPGNYQRGFTWFDILGDAGFRVQKLVHPAPCHAGWLGAATNHLQFVALLERQR